MPRRIDLSGHKAPPTKASGPCGEAHRGRFALPRRARAAGPGARLTRGLESFDSACGELVESAQDPELAERACRNGRPYLVARGRTSGPTWRACASRLGFGPFGGETTARNILGPAIPPQLRHALLALPSPTFPSPSPIGVAPGTGPASGLFPVSTSGSNDRGGTRCDESCRPAIRSATLQPTACSRLHWPATLLTR
jgi:hypothetical protein